MNRAQEEFGTTIEPASHGTVARVDCVEPLTDESWLTLLQNSNASVFHSPLWLKVLADTYGFDVRAYLARDARGAVLGGIPFCEIDDMLGRRVVALPFSDACDPLVSSGGIWQALRERLETHGAPVNLRWLRARDLCPTEDLRVAKRARWHRLAVASSEEEMWAGLNESTKRAVRKAKREGVEIRPLDRQQGCEGFHRLHVALRKSKYRLLAQPLAFFEAIADQFSSQGCWFPRGAFHGNRLVAATVYLKWGNTLYYKFNASAQDALEVRPNNLLVWDGMLLARSLGCQILDLGPSDDDQPGLIRFKSGFGAAEEELQFLQWAPPGWDSNRGARGRRVLGWLGRALTSPQVSDDTTARTGRALYRYFT